MMRIRFFALSVSAVLATTYVVACVGQDYIPGPPTTTDATVIITNPDSTTPTNTQDVNVPPPSDSGTPEEDATSTETEAGKGGGDAGADAEVAPDGSVVFALHATQNTGSPPFAALTTDANGNVIAAMKFNASTTLDGKSMSPDAGGYDVGLMKLTPSGSVTWMRSFGGSGEDQINDIATDANGDIYVAGMFNSSTLTLGPNSALPHRGNSQYDAFVAKLSGANGDVLDAVNLVAVGGNGICTSISVRQNQVLVGCSIAGNASIRDVDGGAEVSKPGIHASSTNVFVTLMSTTDLRSAWSISAGGDQSDRVARVAFGSSGEIFVAGALESSSLESPSAGISIPRKSTGGVGIGDSFLVRIAQNGNAVWGKTYGSGDASTNYLFIRSATVSGGDVFLSGDVKGTVPMGTKTATSAGTNGDVYVARIKLADGDTDWVNVYGGGAYDSAYGVAPAPNGGVYIAGAYFSTGFELSPTMKLPDPLSTTSNLFTARISANGTPLWANGITTAAASTYTQVSAAASDPSGAVFAGTFKGTVNLGDGNPVQSHLTGGGYDFFMVKRNP